MHKLIMFLYTYGFTAVLIVMLCTESLVFVGCPSRSSQAHINTETSVKLTEKEFYSQLADMRIDSIVVTEEVSPPDEVLDLPPFFSSGVHPNRTIKIYGVKKTDAVTNNTEAVKEEAKTEEIKKEEKEASVIAEPIKEGGVAVSNTLRNVRYLVLSIIGLALVVLVYKFFRGK